MPSPDNTATREGKRARVSAGPFKTGLPYYLDAGWLDLVPIIRGGNADKHPAVPGRTGRNAKRASDEALRSWARKFAAYNIAIVLPMYVLGLDVDHYGDKRGGDTLEALSKWLGPLPLTAVSTARDDGISGIRLFRIPASYLIMNWRGVAGPDIDVITWYERYVICAPSVHATGRQYRWFMRGLDGEPGGVPCPDELPMLPEAWCEFLTTSSSNGRFRAHDGNAREWMEDYGDGEMCPVMSDLAPKWLARVGQGAAYDAIKSATSAAVRYTVEGHTGLNAALGPVRAAYIERVGSRGPGERRRGERTAIEEWRRAVDGAVAKFGGNVADDDPCTELEGLWSP
jgi:bifunctional DNA primase/polymerase-like protein